MPYAEKAIASGKRVYHLNIGQPDIPTPPDALQYLRNAEIPVLAYSPANGLLSYREKLSAYYAGIGIDLRPDQLVITSGASEAIQLILMACLDPGEEILIPEPFYANYNGFAEIAGLKIAPIHCSIETGFALPRIEEFEELITSSTRAIFITNPSNPTGHYYPRAVMEALGKLALKYDLFLFVDEVYRDFCYEDEPFFSCMKLPGLEQNLVMVDSVSKRYSACGARVGSVATRNPEVLRALSNYVKLRLSPPVLGQILAEGLLESDPAYLEHVKEEYRKRGELVYQRLQKMPGVLSYHPGGAFYCFARFPVDSSEHFCQWLLEDFEHDGATLMLSPGQGFYATPGMGTDEVRIAYILNLEDLDAAMDCLDQALLVYPHRKEVKPASSSHARKSVSHSN